MHGSLYAGNVTRGYTQRITLPQIFIHLGV